MVIMEYKPLSFISQYPVTEKDTVTQKEIKKDKPISHMIIDSMIIAGITAFSIWNGNIIDINECLPIIKAFGLTFLIQLAYYRKIKKV
jgi:hypothetical protein